MSPRDPHADSRQAGAPGAEALIGPVPAPGLHVMSWNIRRRTVPFHPRRADRWQLRAPKAQLLLRTERPSLLGVQEALPDQARFIRDSLGGAYRFLGRGRGAQGDGEASPIFYDSDRLELLDWEQKALSATPHRPGSRSWGNIFPRTLVCATFRDRHTSIAFLALNTHLDHLSGGSRLRSAQMIRELASASSLPVVFTADANADHRSAAIDELLRGAALADAWAAAAHHDTEEWGTFANYRQPRLHRRRIDWIMTSPQVGVERAAINAQRHQGGWPSDHLPVQAVLQLPQDGGAA